MFSLFGNNQDNDTKKKLLQQELFLLHQSPKIQLEPVDYSKVMFGKYANRSETQLITTEKFYENFDLTSSNLFLCADWNNMIVAGGSITALATKSEINDSDFSDFDVFFYGLSPRECNKKIIELYNSFKQVHTDIFLVRTSRTITFCFGKCKRYIQVIIHVYDSIKSVLNNFDIDCCCIAFDGKNIYTIERGYKAIMRRANTFNLNYASYAYEYRLSKYGYRGYPVEYQYDATKLDNNIYSKDNKQLRGLAKLVSLEKIPDKSKFNVYCDVIDYYQAAMRRNLNKQDDFNYGESGYGGKFMPEWTENKTNNEIKEFCIKQNSSYKFNIFQLGEINSLLIGSAPITLPQDASDFMKTNIVNGKINWSNNELFNKRDVLDFENWINTAYNENTKLEQILNAIKDVRNVELQNLSNGIDLNVRNVVSNTPLSTAILHNNMEALEILRLNGAKLDFVSKLKKTPIHTAVEIGNIEAVKYIINHMPSAIDLEDSYRCTPLLYSIIYGRTEIFKYLYNLKPLSSIVWKHSRSEVNYYGLQLCLYYERYEIAEYLLNIGYDINDHDKNHIIKKCIERHNLKFLSLLFGHENSYKLQYNKSDVFSSISNIISRIEYAFFKLSYAEFIVGYMKLDTKSETLLQELFNSIIKHMSLEDIQTFLDNNSSFLTKRIKVDKVRDIITNLINLHSEQPQKAKVPCNYKLCFDASTDEIYVPPSWCIDVEINSFDNKQIKPLPVSYDRTKYDHYKNVRLILTKYYSQLMPKYETKCETPIETFVNEDNNISSNIEHTKVTKKKVIEISESEDESEESEDDEEEIPQPKKKTIVKTSKTELEVKEKQIIITTTAKPSNIYFRLFDRIKNLETIAQEELSNSNLTCTFVNSGEGFLSIADRYNNLNTYINILTLLLTQTLNTELKYKITTPMMLNIFRTSKNYFNFALDLFVSHHSKLVKSNYFEVLKIIIEMYDFKTYYNVLSSISNDNFETHVKDLLVLSAELSNTDAFFTLLENVKNKSTLEKCLVAMSESKKTINTKCLDLLLERFGGTNQLHLISMFSNKVFDYCVTKYDTLIGSNALHIACKHKCFENIKTLISRFNADIDEQDERGCTALMIAIKTHNKEIFEYLLENGASVDTKDNYGNTPLHLAVLHTFVVGIKTLKAHNIENNFRMTPQDYINNMVKSYFYHARSNQTMEHQLGYVTSVYNNFDTTGLERISANINDVNNTIHEILDKINDGYKLSDLI